MQMHALVQKGVRLQMANRTEAAAECYEQALAINPSSFDALQMLGVLRFRSGDCEAGIVLLRQALTLHPNHAPTLNNLGNALRAAGRLPQALLA
jgi:tetratricopeptide (TPR) repeat protein